MINSSGAERTVFFNSCRAVFQGGGCRAAALVGAYEVAVASGVFLTAVAGTSAGSIIAALIGAGARPEFLANKLRELNFASLLASPKPTDFPVSVTSRLLALVPHSLIRSAGTYYRHGGLYSSEPIEHWVDEALAQLLPHAERPIKFSDLRLPTSIVATDISSQKSKVWSIENSPDASVAFAVRCSCSIPLFFQPVSEGQSLYVDGGLLSNLPAFVYASSDSSAYPAPGDRILAFRLHSTRQLPIKWTPHSLLMHALDSVVDGAVTLQVGLQSQVHSMSIPTGDIKATDFQDMNEEKVDILLDNGRKAAREFIKGEAFNLRPLPPPSVCQSQDHVYHTVVNNIPDAPTEVYIGSPDTYWYWKLFPTFLHWRLQGTKVYAFAIPPQGNNASIVRERQRRAYLKKMGVQIVETAELPLRGYLLVSQGSSESSAVIYDGSESAFAPIATCYNGRRDAAILDLLHKRFKQRLSDEGLGDLNSSKVVALRSASADKLIAKLKKGVSQYASHTVEMSVEVVEVETLKMMVRYIQLYKYQQIDRLVRAYRQSDISLFEPAQVMFGDQTTTELTPPVLEQHGDHLAVLEGNTRAYYCLRNGIKHMTAIVVKGVSSPLPGRPVSPAEVLVDLKKREPSQRMIGFKYEDFRHIERAVRPLDLD